ncbi:hypothetical protein [Hydrogenophaga sp.]|uniref:hypothetical protein n=1 Tax=Hydrogenophaga sp. TaxID=1904254 RepID=UPI002C386B4D|nr:hypothetical protein [Hydrogenophaga sp.]HMP09510.1 hypothetical protein [Hydrogenophaga sp.]
MLKNLASEKGFADYVHITDSTLEAIDFIVNHPPIGAKSFRGVCSACDDKRKRERA